MHIKNDIDVVEFLKQIQKCSSEVWFETPEGDSIALKSTLSQYIFRTIAANPMLLRNGSIRFTNQDDEGFLRDFLCG